MVIPTTSIGNSSIFAEHAKAIIIEINTGQSELLEGSHDVYDTGQQGERIPIPITKADDRIGTSDIPIELTKMKGIVFKDQIDAPSTIVSPYAKKKATAHHLPDFLHSKVKP